MKVENQNYAKEVAYIFSHTNFVKDIGLQFKSCGPGWCESELVVEKRHLQHSNVVHAGVLATMLDNTAGGAAYTLMAKGVNPLTVEFKVNLLRPGPEGILTCKASVLKPGSQISVVESEVFALFGDHTKLVAKATVTITG